MQERSRTDNRRDHQHKRNSSSENILKEISAQLKLIGEKCARGSDSKRDDKRKAYINSRGPPTRTENRHSTHVTYESEKTDNENKRSERQFKKAKRRHDDESQSESDESMEQERKQAEASYIYVVEHLPKQFKRQPLFKVSAIFNGVETEAILDTGASISVITEELANAMDLAVDTSKADILTLADNSKVRSAGITENFSIEVNESKASINAIVLPIKQSPVLLGMDWFHATGASLCPREGTLEFISRPEVRSIKQKDNFSNLDILKELGYEPAEVYMVEASEQQGKISHRRPKLITSKRKPHISDASQETKKRKRKWKQREIGNRSDKTHNNDRQSCGRVFKRSEHDEGVISPKYICKRAVRWKSTRSRYKESEYEHNKIEDDFFFKGGGLAKS